jgi:subtilisin family serine protease
MACWSAASIPQEGKMKRYFVVGALVLCCLFPAKPAAAQTRVIVRDTLGAASLQDLCLLIGCSVTESIDGTLGQVFLVTAPSVLTPDLLISALDSMPGVADAEVDQLLHVQQSSGTNIPNGLYDSTPVNYFGTTVWQGYVDQPAVQIVQLQDVQNTFYATGAGIVAVIDTGIDPTHPAFAHILVPGYDFTRNSSGGSELNDVSNWDSSGQPQPAQVTQSTMAVVDSQNATELSGSNYAAFGHGTMVAGIIHLVAPTAQIMALKAFNANGSGYLSDIMRAVYYAAHNNANVINMSFDFPTSSTEMEKAIQYAEGLGIVCVAAVGNDGQDVTVYPAGYTSLVMGVASTSDNDALSSFSNYGTDVWVAAPGEAIIAPYPFGTYAAGWGTSFSTPFVTGGAALLLSLSPSVSQSQASSALAHAAWISSEAGNGLIDLYQAVSAFQSH